MNYAMKYSVFRDIFIHPKRAFVEITENEKEYFGVALIILGVQVIVALLEFESVMSFLVPETEDKTIGYYSYLIISALFSAFIGAWLMLKVSEKLNKSKSNFKRVFSAIQFTYLPILLLSTPIQAITIAFFSENISVENFVSSISLIAVINIPFAIWGIVLWIMACKQSLQIDTANAIAISILVLIIMAVIFTPISILLQGSFQGWFEI